MPMQRPQRGRLRVMRSRKDGRSATASKECAVQINFDRSSKKATAAAPATTASPPSSDRLPSQRPWLGSNSALCKSWDRKTRERNRRKVLTVEGKSRMLETAGRRGEERTIVHRYRKRLFFSCVLFFFVFHRKKNSFTQKKREGGGEREREENTLSLSLFVSSSALISFFSLLFLLRIISVEEDQVPMIGTVKVRERMEKKEGKEKKSGSIPS